MKEKLTDSISNKDFVLYVECLLFFKVSSEIFRLSVLQKTSEALIECFSSALRTRTIRSSPLLATPPHLSSKYFYYLPDKCKSCLLHIHVHVLALPQFLYSQVLQLFLFSPFLPAIWLLWGYICTFFLLK